MLLDSWEKGHQITHLGADLWLEEGGGLSTFTGRVGGKIQGTTALSA